MTEHNPIDAFGRPIHVGNRVIFYLAKRLRSGRVVTIRTMMGRLYVDIISERRLMQVEHVEHIAVTGEWYGVREPL